jgi:chromosome segregation ATPase
MKVWGVIATIFLIASLCLNVWYYTETTALNANIKQQMGEGYYSEYQLPFETVSELRSNVGQLCYGIQQAREYISQLQAENARLQAQNDEYRTTLAEIQEAAQEAQEHGMWQWLLEPIWSLF